ncbi:MAG: hypothetical protein AB1497_10665 [Bacillota bacterium]
MTLSRSGKTISLKAALFLAVLVLLATAAAWYLGFARFNRQPAGARLVSIDRWEACAGCLRYGYA